MVDVVIKIVISSLIFFIMISCAVLIFNKHQIFRIQSGLRTYTHNLGRVEEGMVTMRDGVSLYTRTYFPKGDGLWPSILIRHPYVPMDALFEMFCEMYVRYGYACVLQITRGQGASEGTWEPVVNESHDGSDTLYWIVEQEWMDGNIAMWGFSYLALSQWSAAFDYPKELKTFMPVSMGTNLHTSLYEKGAFRHMATWWALFTEGGMLPKSVEVDRFTEVSKHMPHIEIDTKFIGKRLDWYREWVSAASLNSQAWQRPHVIELDAVSKKIDIPILLLNGWYDPFFKAQFQDYLDLGSIQKSRMIIGPWDHSLQLSGDLLDKGLDRASKVLFPLSLEWFDHHLRGKPMNDEGYLKAYDMGANEWIIHKSWPAHTELKRLYLSNFSNANDCSSGKLVSHEAFGTRFLQEENISFSVRTGEYIAFVYDPSKPVITRGGSGFIMAIDDEMKAGAVYQSGFCEREDVITFISSPTAVDISISGEIKVQLSVASDVDDSAFTAKLLDVQPDGRAVNIRDSISTLAYRNDVAEPLVYEPNSIVDVAINMWPIEWTLKKGHRLRLDVSSSNFPAFNIHSNFSGPWAEQTITKVAKQILYAPSYVELPIALNVPGITLNDTSKADRVSGKSR